MPADSAPTYLAGLLLSGRRVVVVGGGRVAQRRVAGLLAAGARVIIVAPELTPPLQALADSAQVRWHPRRYRPGDLAGAWYAVTATGDQRVDAAVGQEAEAGRVFCVRADHGRRGTAVTPATGSAAGLQIGVLSAGTPADPRHAAAVRDAILAALADGRLEP